jgi:hypothetical protein
VVLVETHTLVPGGKRRFRHSQIVRAVSLG